MGPNGSGKSTLANAIMGHPNLEVTEGQILFDGEDITEADPDERARAGPVHGLPVPGRDPRRDGHQVPAHGHERAPRGARRGADLAEGVPQDRRGGDGAHQRAEGVLDPLPQRGLLRRREEAHGDPPARAPAAASSRSSTRPTRASTSTRSTSSPHGVNTVAARAPTWASLIITHYQRILHLVKPQLVHDHVRRADRQGGRPGARRAARAAGLRLDPRRGRARRHDACSPPAGAPSSRRSSHARASPTSTPPRRRRRRAGDRGDGRLLPRATARASTAASTRSPREATELFEGARDTVAAFAGSTPGETIFTRNATEAINLVAYAWGRAQRRRRATWSSSPRWSTTPTSCRGRCCAERDRRRARATCRSTTTACSTSTRSTRCSRAAPKLVAVAHVSNVLGTINPVAEIARRAHARRRGRRRRRLAGRAADAGRRRARSTPTSTPGPATRPTGRPASACCTAAASCSRRCRRSSAAGT